MQVEVGRPDEDGRVAVLRIHAEKMRASGRLALGTPRSDANDGCTLEPPDNAAYDRWLADIASRTSGFSGAALAALVRGEAAEPPPGEGRGTEGMINRAPAGASFMWMQSSAPFTTQHAMHCRRNGRVSRMRLESLATPHADCIEQTPGPPAPPARARSRFAPVLRARD